MSDYWKEMKTGGKTVAPPVTKILVPTNEALIRKARTAASWVWGIAGISAMNMALAQSNAPVRFPFGLGFTDFLYTVAHSMGVNPTYAALAINVLVLGCFVGLGFPIKKHRIWAFILSIVLMVLDTGVLFWITRLTMDLPLIALFLHGVAIYSISLGMNASKLYNQRKKSGDAI